jgi:outer membrane receptor protein involved in Fe transport/tRNA A-37 threonylcarbamoyl transferase component Bud32
MTSAENNPVRRTTGIPPHLDGWQLPPGWVWGDQGYYANHRHAQEIIDALGRSLALVTAPDPVHAAWLFGEARSLAHRNHPAIPTTYHFWTQSAGSRRGPGYLRRWIVGETVGARIRRLGIETIPYMLRVLRATGSAVAYLHDAGQTHGALSPDTIYVTPTGRVWILGWQWALPPQEIPAGIRPDPLFTPPPHEWAPGEWHPTPASDQWQLAASCFAILTGELPPRDEIPPLRWVRPDCPANVAELLDRALGANPDDRFHSVASLLRAVEKISGSGTPALSGVDIASGEYKAVTEEDRLRWATGDDFEVLSSLGSGTFGTVWRVRDLTLQREVAMKVLHPSVARSDAAVARFRREAQMAARLQHPAIVPIYEWDSKGDVHWYVMELEDEGSVADLVRRMGPRPLAEVAPQIDAIHDGLHAAHESGILHRDLKPENLLIDRYRRWRIADFGIANAMGEEWAGSSGTPAFAPPEQLLGEPQGVAADLFAVAAIVYFALTGAAPFVGEDGRAILAQQLAGSANLTRFHPELAGWLRKGLAADPDQRFTDAAEMQAEWRRVTRDVLEHESRLPWGARVAKAIRSGFGGATGAVLVAAALAAPAHAQERAQARADSVPAVPRDSVRAKHDSVRTERDSTTQSLSRVHVTVTRTDETAQRAPWAVGMQDKSDIQVGRATHGIDEALNNIPGVYVANRYNYSLDQRLSIRGAGSRANFGIRGVKVLLDGVPQSLPDGQNQLSNLELGDISRVEVLRGSASSLYGNGSGGVIAFTTDMSAQDRLDQTLRVEGGSFGTTKWQSRTSGRDGSLVGSLSASRTIVDGFRQFSNADLKQLNGAADYGLGASTLLALRAFVTEMPTALNPGALTAAEYAANRDTASATNIRRDASKAISQNQFSLRMQHTAGDGGSYAATAYVVRRFVDNPLSTSPPGTAGATVGTYSTINRWVTGVRIDASHPLCSCANAPRLATGIDIERSLDLRRNSRATGGHPSGPTDTIFVNQSESVSTVGPFADVEWSPAARLSLSAGARWDRTTFTVIDHFFGDHVDNSGSRAMTATTGHLGASYVVVDAFTPYASWSTAFETPTTTELGQKQDGTGGFNASLGPAQIHTIEAGARGSFGAGVTYTLSAFRLTQDNAIVQFLQSGSSAYYTNAGRIRNDGLEFGIAARAAGWADVNLVWTEANYRFVKYVFPAGAVMDTLNGKKLSGVPDRFIRLGVRTHWSGWTLDADETWSSSMYADDANTQRISSWGSGDLNVRATWTTEFGSVRLQPYASVNNLLGQAYIGSVTINGAAGRTIEPAPLRNYYFGMEIGWRAVK